MWQDLFYQIVTLGSLGRFVCKPYSNDSLLLQGVARRIPRHERPRRYNFMKAFRSLTISSRVFQKGGVLVLDDLKAAELEKRELLDLFTNIFIIKITPCCTYAKTCSHQGNTPRVCPETTTTRWKEGILRQCPGVYSLLWAI